MAERDHGLLSLIHKNHPGNKSVDKRYWSALKIMTKGGNIEQAYDFLLSASNDGDAYSNYALGTWYLDGFFLKKDKAKGVKLIRQAAEANVAYAAYDLATCYELGEGGVRRNINQATRYYLRAFLWGDLQAAAALERILYWEKDPLGRRTLSRELGRYLASIGK